MKSLLKSQPKFFFCTACLAVGFSFKSLFSKYMVTYTLPSTRQSVFTLISAYPWTFRHSIDGLSNRCETSQCLSAGGRFEIRGLALDPMAVDGLPAIGTAKRIQIKFLAEFEFI
jgi:hypothetical protein